MTKREKCCTYIGSNTPSINTDGCITGDGTIGSPVTLNIDPSGNLVCGVNGLAFSGSVSTGCCVSGVAVALIGQDLYVTVLDTVGGVFTDFATLPSGAVSVLTFSGAFLIHDPGSGAGPTQTNLCDLIANNCPGVNDVTPSANSLLITYDDLTTSAVALPSTFTCADLASCSIDAFSDVSISGATAGQTLTYSGGAWTPTTISKSEMARISGSTYYSIQDMQDVFHSTGQTTGGEIVDNGDGSITVNAGTGLIRATNSDVTEILFFDWIASSGANVAIVDNDLNYIYVEYNAGAPRAIATTTKRTDLHTNVYLGTVYRYGIDLHITSQLRIKVNDHASLMEQRSNATAPFARETGGMISETGTLNFAISSGFFWMGLVQVSLPGTDTSISDDFIYFYRDGIGGWTQVSGQTTIDNLQYDDGTGTIATLSNSRYGVHWVYRGIDGDTYVIYGRDSYTLPEAQSAESPADVPPHFESHARLFGRIIIAKSDTTFTEISSSFQDVFIAGSPTQHNDLTGLQGGQAGEYYHLTNAEYISLLSLSVSGFIITDCGLESTTATIDWEDNTIHNREYILTSSGVSLAMSATDLCNYRLLVRQGNNGANTVLWPANVLWTGAAPQPIIGSGQVSVFEFFYDGSNFHGL